MKNCKEKVQSIITITPDVLKIVTDKPATFDFEPEMATEIAINKNGWLIEKRPFTMTNLPNNKLLEFIIKTYPQYHGVTNELLDLKKNEALIPHSIFGTITYKREGVFIARGAAIMPFIAILRALKEKNEIGANMLLFANKTKADIIHEQELGALLGNQFINKLSDVQFKGYSFLKITQKFLEENIKSFKKHFYLCSPPQMIEDIEKM